MGTFAVAALVVAVLFADRLAPSEEIKRRFFQIGLAVTVVLFTAALAMVVVPVSGDARQGLSIGPDNEQGARILRERVTVAAGAGLLVLLASMYFSRTFVTLALGGMLGALVLLIGSISDSSGGLITAYYDLALDGGESRNAVYAGVSGVGLLLLLLYGFNEWDKPAEESELEADL
jgi:hypothetical protein